MARSAAPTLLRHDAPPVDPASLPAAGASSRRSLSTAEERRLKEAGAPTHYTFVDGAVLERPGGRRPPPRGTQAVTTRVNECLGNAIAETSTFVGAAVHERPRGRRPPLRDNQAVATRVHECMSGAIADSSVFVENAGNECLGGRRPPLRDSRAVTTRVHECMGNAMSETSTERSVEQHFTIVNGAIPTAKAKGGRASVRLNPELKPESPGRGRAHPRPGHVAVTTSVGSMLRQDLPPSNAVELKRLVVR
mmetsp:Transcript_18136/g.36935  ORF Transcript_18136/g.36935 Transcript_18136/m.36935 type:complete len:250 (+) Transcript_18136:2-751(+)